MSLVIQKTLAELVSEVRRGYLGMLWWVIEPVLYMGAFYVLFVVVFERGGEDAISSLLIGLVVWKWFAISIPQSANSISTNKGLINQVYVPKFVFPIMVAMSNTIKFLIVFLMLLIFLLIAGKVPDITWLSIPIILVIQQLMLLAIGCLLASISPFLPDLKILINNAILLLFFFSGIFFDISMASPELQSYLYMNPMAGLIESYRHVLLAGEWPDWLFLVKLSLCSLVGLLAGLKLLNHYDRVYAKVV